jgi:hypothetical protein
MGIHRNADVVDGEIPLWSSCGAVTAVSVLQPDLDLSDISRFQKILSRAKDLLVAMQVTRI